MNTRLNSDNKQIDSVFRVSWSAIKIQCLLSECQSRLVLLSCMSCHWDSPGIWWSSQLCRIRFRCCALISCERILCIAWLILLCFSNPTQSWSLSLSLSLSLSVHRKLLNFRLWKTWIFITTANTNTLREVTKSGAEGETAGNSQQVFKCP